MRSFIGIDFNTDIKNEIYELQQRIRKYAVKGRWKYIDNFHLTLKFLNEISLSQQAQIDAIMKKVCINKERFNLKLTEPGIFEGKDSVRVLWLGLEGDIQPLHSLQKEIDKALNSIGFSLEKRKFKPHITIGQDIVFEHEFDHIKKSLENILIQPIPVESLFLFKSEQIQNKRIYTKVSEYSFSKII